MDQSHTGTEASGISVRHVEREDGGAFYAEEAGTRVGEMTWSRGKDGVAVIAHTEVDVAERNRGVGRALVAAAVSWARASGTKLAPMCSYAAAVLRRDKGARDVLAR
ncbi:MAG: GNAT family N-acetyltransferase [Anaeromyxobacteraceae bacterium]